MNVCELCDEDGIMLVKGMTRKDGPDYYLCGSHYEARSKTTCRVGDFVYVVMDCNEFMVVCSTEKAALARCKDREHFRQIIPSRLE